MHKNIQGPSIESQICEHKIIYGTLYQQINISFIPFRDSIIKFSYGYLSISVNIGVAVLHFGLKEAIL